MTFSHQFLSILIFLTYAHHIRRRGCNAISWFRSKTFLLCLCMIFLQKLIQILIIIIITQLTTDLWIRILLILLLWRTIYLPLTIRLFSFCFLWIFYVFFCFKKIEVSYSRVCIFFPAQMGFVFYIGILSFIRSFFA